MATCHLSDEESSSGDSPDVSDYDTGSDDESDSEPQSKPCKYYNSGHCRDGDRCGYLHVCQYALKGHCRYGSSCKLKHPTHAKASSHARKWASDPSDEADPKFTDGQPYQWQLHDGKVWKDVDNDHIIEAQYCLPHTKSIKIYNTPYGAISIDFNRMRVHGKSLGVRRLDDGRTVWTWYCSLGQKWRKYDDNISKGNSSPVKSSDIEKKFQSDPSGSVSFIIGNDTFNIKFTEMRQVSQKKKRKVCRRPVYRQTAGAGVSQAASALKHMSLGAKWEFQGKHGWHKFKQSNSSGCSVTSDDIEGEYQKNCSGSMNFQVKGQSYKLDFKENMNDFEDLYATSETHIRQLGFKEMVTGTNPVDPPGFTGKGSAFCGDNLPESPFSAFPSDHGKCDLDSLNMASGGKLYEWQMQIGGQWLLIDNDHVIESHYCHPGAKGISLNTSHGTVFVDFDNLQTTDPALKVQRVTFLPQGQAEDVGWYFRDDVLWREYGSQGPSMASSSVSSRDVEQQYVLNSQGTFRFTVGSTGYRLDFSTMAQLNCNTGLRRNVRRRPKPASSSVSLDATAALPVTPPTQLSKWEFMGEEGVWTEYQAYICSFDSAAIEAQYQLNPQGQLFFSIRRFSYTLDFSRMCQINNKIGTIRAVRRTLNYGSQQTSSGTQPRWQFKDISGIWTDYSKSIHQCSVSSPEIELQYQQDPSGIMKFNTRTFSYELDFSAMTQRNLSTNTTRSVRRLDQ